MVVNKYNIFTSAYDTNPHRWRDNSTFSPMYFALLLLNLS
jgi:hypothetical protein